MAKDIVTRVGLTKETVKELKKAIEFYKKMEKDLNRDPENFKFRLENGKFDRERVIREVLKDWNE